MDTYDDVNKRNILAVKEHSEATRAMARAMQKQCDELRTMHAALELENMCLKKQLQALQVKVYSGGSTEL